MLIGFFDTPVTLIILWTGPSGQQLSDNDRITIQPWLMAKELVYKSRVAFDPVEEEDSGSYGCQVVVVSKEKDTINSSNTTSLVLTVRGWTASLNATYSLVNYSLNFN